MDYVIRNLLGLMFDAVFAPILVILLASIAAAVLFRRVVETDMVHIVQSRKKTVSYGVGEAVGNVYYHWPSWVPIVGITVKQLPISNFDLSLESYEAYDTDRVPFVVDVTAFFRIADTQTAAQRVVDVKSLKAELLLIVQGAVRKVLASDKIDDIMLERSKFGDSFTNEVADQLTAWGVEPVKAMELMDIRDAGDSRVIENIMAKKKSFIEMESRVEVAENNRIARVAEIEADREVDLRNEQAAQAVGERVAEKDRAVGIADEQAKQSIKEQQAITAEKEMTVRRVEAVKQAEITKDEQVVVAEQEKETTIIRAEGDLQAKHREAKGIETIGLAEASAEKAMQLAPVEAQIALAKEIGENEGYQSYLMTIDAIAAQKVIGVEQAQALTAADVKVIANAGNAGDGMSKAMDLFTSQGGTNLGSMLEGLMQTPSGEALLARLGVKPETAKTVANEIKTGSASALSPSDAPQPNPPAPQPSDRSLPKGGGDEGQQP